MGEIFGRGLAHGFSTGGGGAWRDRAGCADADPELFSPLPGDVATIQQALAFCGRCPVAAECGADAIDAGDSHTIRGGKTPEQRAASRRVAATAELAAARRNFAAANAARAEAKARRGGRCLKGLHEMTADNTYISNAGYACCKACRVEQQRQYRQRITERGRQVRALAELGVGVEL